LAHEDNQTKEGEEGQHSEAMLIEIDCMKTASKKSEEDGDVGFNPIKKLPTYKFLKKK